MWAVGFIQCRGYTREHEHDIRMSSTSKPFPLISFEPSVQFDFTKFIQRAVLRSHPPFRISPVSSMANVRRKRKNKTDITLHLGVSPTSIRIASATNTFCVDCIHYDYAAHKTYWFSQSGKIRSVFSYTGSHHHRHTNEIVYADYKWPDKKCLK